MVRVFYSTLIKRVMFQHIVGPFTASYAEVRESEMTVAVIVNSYRLIGDKKAQACSRYEEMKMRRRIWREIMLMRLVWQCLAVMAEY